jgi:hypothetical protein
MGQRRGRVASARALCQRHGFNVADRLAIARGCRDTPGG